MKIVKNHIIPFGTFVAITFGPWIFTRREELSDVTVNHEAIHWAQQKETLIVGFFILYGVMFLWELVRCTFDPLRANHADGRHRPLWKRAYRSVAFEQEAYAHEADISRIAKSFLFGHLWFFISLCLYLGNTPQRLRGIIVWQQKQMTLMLSV